MKEWIIKELKITGRALLFVCATPFLVAAILIGFRTCWQCGKFGHVFTMSKYWTWLDRKKPVDVCRYCRTYLKEYDEEGLL